MNCVQLLKDTGGSACSELLLHISTNIVVATCAEAVYDKCKEYAKTENELYSVRERLDSNDKYDNRAMLEVRLNAVATLCDVLEKDIDTLCETIERDYRAKIKLIKEILS